jgi:hypothetical protein
LNEGRGGGLDGILNWYSLYKKVIKLIWLDWLNKLPKNQKGANILPKKRKSVADRG